MADTMSRTGRDPASFRPLAGIRSHMNIHRKSQEIVLAHQVELEVGALAAGAEPARDNRRDRP